MPTQFKIDDAENGLIAVLRSSPLLPGVQVDGLSSKDFDEQGNLVAIPPAALVMFDATQDNPSQDPTRKTYQTYHDFLVFVGAQDLRTAQQERSSAQALVDSVRATLAGQRLPLDGGTSQTGPVELAGVSAEQYGKDGTWYSVRVRVQAIAQF
ncbi:MAG TPA: phage protein Gp37 [Candidatus Angelobacter sp.]|nr:phage protein Gp37 [Candidatus Angelobacter sp.]